MGLFQPGLDNLDGKTSPGAGSRPGIAHARFGEYPCIKTDSDLEFLGARAAGCASHLNTVVAEVLERHAAEISGDVGSKIARRIVNLIEKLLLDGGLVHASPGLRQLCNDRAAIAHNFGDRIAAVRKIWHLLDARIGKIASGDLHAAFHQMADQRTGTELCKIAVLPTVVVH